MSIHKDLFWLDEHEKPELNFRKINEEVTDSRFYSLSMSCHFMSHSHFNTEMDKWTDRQTDRHFVYRATE